MKQKRPFESSNEISAQEVTGSSDQPARRELFLRVGFPATYLLHLHLTEGQTLTIGARKPAYFDAGEYFYVGSALRAAGHRLLRHWQGSEVRKWHIDYLRAVTLPRKLYVYRAESIGECDLAQLLQQCSELRVIPRFGSSDCRCPGHLWHAQGTFRPACVLPPANLTFS